MLLPRRLLYQLTLHVTCNLHPQGNSPPSFALVCPIFALWSDLQTTSTNPAPSPLAFILHCLTLCTTHASPPPQRPSGICAHQLPYLTYLLFPYLALRLQGHINSALPTPSWQARQKPEEARAIGITCKLPPHRAQPDFASEKSPDPIANTRSYIYNPTVIALRRLHRQNSRASRIALRANRLPLARSISVLHLGLASRLSRIPLESCRLAIKAAEHNQARNKRLEKPSSSCTTLIAGWYLPPTAGWQSCWTRCEQNSTVNRIGLVNMNSRVSSSVFFALACCPAMLVAAPWVSRVDHD